MPQLSSLIPLVKKSKYHQKKAQINSFEDNLRTVKNYQQLFKNLVEELAELEELLAEKNGKLAQLSRERERERESNRPPSSHWHSHSRPFSNHP